MASSRLWAAFAALSLATTTHAWNIELPPCLDDFKPFVYSGCFQDGLPGEPLALPYRSSADTQDMTVEKCVAECKGNGFRYAGLEYYGVCFCGMTVNGPQVDEDQCSYTCTGNDTQTCGGESTLSVWADPTFPPTDDVTIADYDHIGCWTDDAPGGRTLSWPVDDIDSDTMTTELCLSACKANGYPFAGTEFGGECWCGNVIANETSLVDASECNMPCNGDDSQTCGGPGRLTLYEAEELRGLEPCGYEPPETTTSAPPTSTTAPPETSTSSVCVATVTVTPEPECEYKCGKWCAHGLPDWDDEDGCRRGGSSCSMQVAACFAHAGWPEALGCWDFKEWCKSIENYCDSNCKRNNNNGGGNHHGFNWPSHWGWKRTGGRHHDNDRECRKRDCFNHHPPPNNPNPPEPTVSVTTVPCEPTATTTTPTSSTSSTTCVPTPTNICKQPSSHKYGYGPGNPVGGIDLPPVTCNDIEYDFHQKPFKLYTDSNSRRCRAYRRNECKNACKDACKAQYDDCVDVYAEGCRSWNKKRDEGSFSYFDMTANPEKRWFTSMFSDRWDSAKDKCSKQYHDCLDENKHVNPGELCEDWSDSCE